METKELAEQLIPWLRELAAGKTLQYVFSDGCGYTNIGDIDHLIHHLQGSGEIRIKQTPIPPAPDDDSWQNPDNLTAEQIGIDQGWRLLLKSEIGAGRGRICQMWHFGEWLHGAFGNCEDETYRVAAQKFPLGMLRDPADERVLKQNEREIADHFIKRRFHVREAEIIAQELMAGKVPHVGVK